MAKLSGWRRMGIIASVLWVLGAWVYTYNSEIDRASELIARIHVQCDSNLPNPSENEDAYNAAFDRCNKEADDSLALAITGARESAAFAALVPVPLGWGCAYLIFFLVQWVRRGFELNHS